METTPQPAGKCILIGETIIPAVVTENRNNEITGILVMFESGTYWDVWADSNADGAFVACDAYAGGIGGRVQHSWKLGSWEAFADFWNERKTW